MPGTNNQLSRAELSLAAASAQTRWANLTNFHLLLHLPSLEGQTNLVNANLTLKAGDALTPWAGTPTSGSKLALVPAKDQAAA